MYPNIRALREDLDISQKELAQQLNISQTNYSKYEAGEKIISIGILVKLAEFYGTSVDYLLGLTDERRPYPAKRPKKG